MPSLINVFLRLAFVTSIWHLSEFIQYNLDHEVRGAAKSSSRYVKCVGYSEAAGLQSPDRPSSYITGQSSIICKTIMFWEQEKRQKLALLRVIFGTNKVGTVQRGYTT